MRNESGCYAKNAPNVVPVIVVMFAFLVATYRMVARFRAKTWNRIQCECGCFSVLLREWWQIREERSGLEQLAQGDAREVKRSTAKY
jgi:hypothetical protein